MPLGWQRVAPFPSVFRSPIGMSQQVRELPFKVEEELVGAAGEGGAAAASERNGSWTSALDISTTTFNRAI